MCPIMVTSYALSLRLANIQRTVIIIVACSIIYYINSLNTFIEIISIVGSYHSVVDGISYQFVA